MGKEEQDLIIGVGVTKDDAVQASYSHLRAEFADWLVEVHNSTPPHLQWFSKCWDQQILIVLVHRNFKFVMAAHECVGRGKCRGMLWKLRDELLPLLGAGSGILSGASNVSKMEKKLKAVATSFKGFVPPREVLILYKGAPKKFLTKEDQAPEYLDHEGGKSRLQKELEDFDDDDDFLFSLEKKKAEEDEEEFSFTVSAPKPQPIFTSPHPRVVPAPQQAARPALKKIPSPVISSDFSWNGAKVTPEGEAHEAAHPAPAKSPSAKSPMATGMFGGLHNLAMRGKSIFSAQFEKAGGAQMQHTVADGKVRGHLASLAPSGLSWEDEIASQLAAAGVRVSAAGGGADGEQEENVSSVARTKSLAVGFRAGMPPISWRANSVRVAGQGEASDGAGKGKALSKITRGLRKSMQGPSR